MKREKYLLIGNGLNRCIDNGISWGDLLEKIAYRYNVDYINTNAMPLEFERILNQALKNNFDKVGKEKYVLNNMKKEVAKSVENATLPDNAIHRELLNVDVDGIMTTNYDTLLEQVFDSNYQYEGGLFKKYLFEKTAEINNKKFYHLHGISDCPKSLCLGYEHYMGIVEKMRAAINTQKDNKPTEMNIKRVLYGEDMPTDNYYEKFYTSDIAIVGLSLDINESDLWWLITHRAYLYHSDYSFLASRDILNNRIVYYHIESKYDIEQEKKLRLLRDLHVEVKRFTLYNNSYSECYHRMLEDIKKEFSTT